MNGRLHGADFIAGENFQIGQSVFAAVCFQFPELWQVFFAGGQDQRTNGLKTKVQFPVQFGKLFSALIAKTALQFAVAFCVSAVHDGAVCLGGTHGNIVGFFDQCNVQLIAAQPSGDGGANDTGTNDANVSSSFTHMVHPLFCLFPVFFVFILAHFRNILCDLITKGENGIFLLECPSQKDK